MLRILVERGADTNKANNNWATPLYIASRKGHVDVVRILAERGADINKARDNGSTPLLIAA